MVKKDLMSSKQISIRLFSEFVGQSNIFYKSFIQLINSIVSPLGYGLGLVLKTGILYPV